jgi:hypothetical protein
MQSIRRRIAALEKSLLLKKVPEVLVVKRDAVTGKWTGSEGNRGDPAMCIVVLCSDAAPDPNLVIDARPRIIDSRHNDEMEPQETPEGARIEIGGAD